MTVRTTSRRKIGLAVFVGALLTGGLWIEIAQAQAPPESGEAPWWNQGKIRFGWGSWANIFNRHARSHLSAEDLFENLSRVGMTVFVEHSPGYDLDRARLARKFGLRYFATEYIQNLPNKAEGARRAIDELGKEVHHCPLDRSLYERWFLNYALEVVKTDLVDGLHMDWEPYPDESGPLGVQIACVCDFCFSGYAAGRHLDADVPTADRFSFLEGKHRLADYYAYLEDETAAMFREFAERVHAVKPDFVFSAYGGYSPNKPEYRWRMYGLARGLTSSDVPFLVLDHRHYWDDHTRPWWYSFYDYNRSLGLKTIGGTWDNSMFGGRPDMAVSAAQCLYDIGINMDGHWLWFEQDPAPELYQTWEIANRRMAAVERRVGEFLFHGEEDIRFVTPVEWSGNPALERKIIHRTFHLRGEHLVHVNNVSTDRPVTLRIRFPHLGDEADWIVRDAMEDLVYVPDADASVWTSRHLHAGLQLSLVERGEVWLKVSPASDNFRPERGSRVLSATIKTMPGHGK
jgi:hypothetical protein